MKIAIASGKGGTGKTTVSASLAAVWPGSGFAVDLDVEAPNLHLFLEPHMSGFEKAYINIPKVQDDRCSYCGACADLCQFKAISVLKNVLMVFSEMCHGCGGCFAICPTNALMPDKRELGEIHWGETESFGFLMGRLRVGEAMSSALIKHVKAKLDTLIDGDAKDAIIDAPPGVSCPAVNAVMGADIVVLVTEPTPFGLYDLHLAYEAFNPLGKPMGVVINRAGLGDNTVYDFCRSKGIPIWAEIPYSREIAVAYANNQIIAQVSSILQSSFSGLAEHILRAHAVHREVLHA